MRPNQSDPLILIPNLGLSRRIFQSFLWFLLLAGTFCQTWAAPPTNDVCTGAELIPADVFPVLTSVKDMAEATTTGDPPLPSCVFVSTFSHSLWYTFTPKATAFYTISSCADAPTATTVPDT